MSAILATFSLGTRADCFAGIDYMPKPSQKADRALYILVDQTLPLPDTMRQKITTLLDSWGRPGDLVKIVRFSTNARGKYPELVFSRRLDKTPNEDFFYNLRWQDKQRVTECIQTSNQDFRDKLTDAIATTLSGMDPLIQKTELLFTLKEISKQLIVTEEAKQHTVLLVSDGLENSSSASFYRRGKIRSIDVRGVINKIRRQGLIGHWKGANIYMYGMGLAADEKKPIKTETLKQLRAFWEQYFVEGGGKIKALGMPELLVTSIE